METGDDSATMRESLTMVQNILFIDYNDILRAHEWENMAENLPETMQFGLVI